MRNLFLALTFLCAGVWTTQVRSQLIGLPPAPELSDAGRRLIYDFEIGDGRCYYERFLSHPTWPGAASGITVAIGYDCGYNSRNVILSDWHALDAKTRLASTSGIRGRAAQARLREVQDILIAWNLAEDVFNRVTLARFWQLTARTFPGFDALQPSAQAALVSLVFNRGNSLAGPGRIEMREIARLTPHKDYAGIASQIRSMKRLWSNRRLDGLLHRREAEAQLIESCK